jgi:hypothetical protein
MTAKLTGKNKTSYLNQFGGIAIVEEEAEVGGGGLLILLLLMSGRDGGVTKGKTRLAANVEFSAILLLQNYKVSNKESSMDINVNLEWSQFRIFCKVSISI